MRRLLVAFLLSITTPLHAQLALRGAQPDSGRSASTEADTADADSGRAKGAAPADSGRARTRDGVAMAMRVAGTLAPRIDGRLDDPAWARAPELSNFVQRDPEEGRPASERTDVKVLFTNDALYVGVHAWDSDPDAISGQLTRRDEDSPSDWIAIGIDSWHDRRTGYLFYVNPAGVKRDVYLFNDTQGDGTWDAVWDAAVSRDSTGWSAEFRIPFSQLRYPETVNHVFGFQVLRVISRRAETDLWRFIPKGMNAQVSQWGELDGVRSLTAPRRLELLPYTVARAARYAGEPGNPFRTGRDQSATAGLDLKYGVTPGLTLDATVNPDFGQVEADPAVVNLSAFETFFPEQRPFFAEGVNIFSFPIGGGGEQLFYSRRIGRAPEESAPVPAGGFAEPVDHTRILGAAKLSGSTPGGWTTGLLTAVTAEEQAAIVDSLGASSSAVVEPMAQYFVARLARDFRQGGTEVGVFATAMHRDLTSGITDLRRDATSAAFDWNHRFNHDAYRFRGWVAASDIRGPAPAILAAQESPARYFQRPGNTEGGLDSTRTELSGFAAQASLGKEDGEWRWSAAVDTRSPGFEVNDIGFMRSADYLSQSLWLSKRWLKPGRVFRGFQWALSQYSVLDYGGTLTGKGASGSASGTFQNYWSAGIGVNRQGGGFSNALRGGPYIVQPSSWSASAWTSTDYRKQMTFSLGMWGFHQDDSNAKGFGIGPSIGYRPSGNVELSASPGFSVNHDTWQYLATESFQGASQYLFGELKQSTASLSLRGNITFSPTLTLQVYAQPFYSAGRYVAVKHVTDPRLPRFADRIVALDSAQARRDSAGDIVLDFNRDGTPDATLGNPDFSYASLRSNVVLRWEYRPGSTLFLVWQQQRSDANSDGSYAPAAAWQSLAAARPANVFLVKLNYWLSL